MRVCVISDIQADQYERLSTVRADGYTSRLHDVLTAFDWAVAEGIKAKCDVLCIPGDIFDNRTSISLPVLDGVCRHFFAASRQFKATYIIAGNHDSYLRSPRVNALQSFSGFATIVDEGPVLYGNVAFIPWHDDPGQVTAWALEASSAGASYLFSHALVQGSVPGNKGIPPAALLPEKFKRIILGDVHEPTVIKPNIHYAGALLQLHFGDVNGTRGFQILDTARNQLTHVPNTLSPRFHIIRDGVMRDVRSIDFVRVESDDAELAARAVGKVRAAGAWVEANAPAPETIIAPRADIRTSHSDADILSVYLAHQRIDDPDLLALGAEIMAAARSND